MLADCSVLSLRLTGVTSEVKSCRQLGICPVCRLTGQSDQAAINGFSTRYHASDMRRVVPLILVLESLV